MIAAATIPRLTILVPVWNPPLDLLRKTIQSILGQSYSQFQVVLADDDSSTIDVWRVLTDFERRDPRITALRNPSHEGIVATLNLALTAAAGDFIAVVDHDDLLAPQALERCMAVLDSDPECDFLYTDEAWIDPEDRSVGDFLKPDWSPERLRCQMYTNHLSVYRRELVGVLGGFRAGFDGSQDYDLALRVSEKARRVTHLPEILYYWRIHQGQVSGSSNESVYNAARRAIEEHCHRVGIKGSVEQTDPLGSYRVHRSLENKPLVSVIIPTRGSTGRVWGRSRTFVVDAIQSIISKSSYPSLEFVVVADECTPEPVLKELRDLCGQSLRLVSYRRDFNYSHKMNLGVLASAGEYVVLLNDDIELMTHDWIETLLGFASEPDVGAAGCLLYFEDGSIQHAGHIYQNGNPHHIAYGFSADSLDPSRALGVDRECSGVTAACAMMSREDYIAIGGLSRNYAFSFNDVDLCLKLRSQGKRIICSPWAKLYHFESKTREEGVAARELEQVRRRWGRMLDGDDPYWRNGSTTA